LLLVHEIEIPFGCGLLFCLTPWASPPMALLAGLIFGAVADLPTLVKAETCQGYCYKPRSLVWAST